MVSFSFHTPGHRPMSFTHIFTARKFAKVMFLQVSICPWGGGMRGRGACVVGGHAWQGDMRGRGHVWWGGACMAGEHVWQEGYVWWGTCMAGGVHGRGYVWWGACMAGGVCMVGGMHSRGHAWQGCMHGRGVHGRRACMAGGMHGGGIHGRGCMHGRGVCMTGGHAWHACPPADTTRYCQWAGGTRPTGMHSCWGCYRVVWPVSL